MSAALLRLLAGVLSAVSLDRRPRVVSEHPDELGYRLVREPLRGVAPASLSVCRAIWALPVREPGARR